MRLALCLLVCALAGCATCREHPVACGVAVGALATGVALSLRDSHEDYRHFHRVQR